MDPIPRRILSLVPSVTECLFDLGAGGRVVGRTDFCLSPASTVGCLPTVGGPKTVDVGTVLDLRPDLVLANAEENARREVQELIDRGLRVHVAFPRTVAHAMAFLRDLAILIGSEDRTGPILRILGNLLAEPPRPAVACACLIWKSPYMTASADTLTSALIEAAGGRNVFGPHERRYPVITPADLVTARPTVLLLPTEPYDFSEADARELQRFVPRSRPLRVPGEWVTWYGTRMVRAVRGLRAALDPYRGMG